MPQQKPAEPAKIEPVQAAPDAKPEEVTAEAKTDETAQEPAEQVAEGQQKKVNVE